MSQREMEIVNRLGLHARAAAQFVQLAARYKSDVFIEKDGEEINGKSIMGILMLAAPQGTLIRVRTQGEDEDAALDALEKLVHGKFGED
ncbi:MAG: HPr family phosphocarrier protein [Desulfuromonadaceae bacterium]|nr:HPr family phosphocarrier protein [Desulfuromonadaceae bacterium]